MSRLSGRKAQKGWEMRLESYWRMWYSGMGMEVCCTLGMLNEEQAKQLKEAGLTAYNHNLDTSREFYPKVT